MLAGDMDVDVVDPRTGPWWEFLTSNPLRMRDFEKTIKACGLSSWPVTEELSRKLDEALENEYYFQFPGERYGRSGGWGMPSPNSNTSISGGVGGATTNPTTTSGYPHAIPNFEKAQSSIARAIYKISQKPADVPASPMASDSIAIFLKEKYPDNAPFNSEALLANGFLVLGIGDRRDGGNAFRRRPGKFAGRPGQESPHANKRAKLSAASSHDKIAAPLYYTPSGTHTLQSESTAPSPSTWRSFGQSSLPTDASTSPSERRRGSVGSAHSVPSPQLPTRARGRFPAATPRSDSIHRSKSLNNAGGRKGGGGQKKHLCEICGMAFLYPSKLSDHKYIHSNIKGLVCDICSSSFKRSRELIAHRKTHLRKRETSEGAPQQEVTGRERSDSQDASVPAVPPPRPRQWSEGASSSDEASPQCRNDAYSVDEEMRSPSTRSQLSECSECQKERMSNRPFDGPLTRELFGS